MNLLRVCFPLTILVLVGCGVASQPTPPASPVNNLPEYIILSDGDFIPDESTVASIRSQLPTFLAQNQNKFNSTQAPIVERLATYKVQYWGEMENGKRIIAVNALCKPFDGWQTKQILVLDGGDCFFNLKYDIEAGTFFDLSVNGEA